MLKFKVETYPSHWLEGFMFSTTMGEAIYKVTNVSKDEKTCTITGIIGHVYKSEKYPVHTIVDAINEGRWTQCIE